MTSTEPPSPQSATRAIRAHGAKSWLSILAGVARSSSVTSDWLAGRAKSGSVQMHAKQIRLST